MRFKIQKCALKIWNSRKVSAKKSKEYQNIITPDISTVTNIQKEETKIVKKKSHWVATITREISNFILLYISITFESQDCNTSEIQYI